MDKFDSILANISPYYHKDFMQVSTSFQDFEDIKFACNVSSFVDNVVYASPLTLQIGYLIVTSYRFIWHFFISADSWSGIFHGYDAKRPRLRVYRPARPTGLADFWVIDPPNFPITEKENRGAAQELNLGLITGIYRRKPPLRILHKFEVLKNRFFSVASVRLW